MVSTRGIKLKFSENERVLCYEPDPTKAKVLYDSKVLDVVITKDTRGRKTVEYLIHFQGWNSSWDRYVSEEYVLKDTPENRQLQKDLAEKSQLQLGAYLYRKDRRKHKSGGSDPRTGPSSDDGSSGSPPMMDTLTTDEGHSSTGDEDMSEGAEEEEEDEDDLVAVELTQELREILEQDYCLINTKHKLPKLPAEPNVVQILELYWQHYMFNLVNEYEKSNKSRYQGGGGVQGKLKLEDAQRSLNICQEVLDGIRLYFDFTLTDLLLYKPEVGQFQTGQAVYSPSLISAKDDTKHKNYLDLFTHHFSHLNGTDDDSVTSPDTILYNNESSNNNGNNSNGAARRRTLRSNKSPEANCANGGGENSVKSDSSLTVTPQPSSAACAKGLEAGSWKLLPESVYSQSPPPPCLVYGAVHLARLFVKMPELLTSSGIQDGKMKTLQRHFENFIDFLNDRKEWFGEKFYKDAATV